MSETKHSWIIEEARKDFAAGMNWMDFNNKYFGLGNHYIPRDEKDRALFLNSYVYKEIQIMKEQLEEKQTEVISPTEKSYSGAISLRVPKSLHQSLAEEAEREGVSLNQLILAKISATLYDQLRGRR